MEPIYGFLLFGLAVVVVTVVASQRHGVGAGALYFIGMCAIGFGLVVLASRITDGDSIIAGFSAFVSPLIGLILALSSPSDGEIEAAKYRKCPFCAEPIKKEAVKCKHCGSDLKQINGADK